MNKAQKTGTVQNLKGRFKQALGVISGDKAKESEGASERLAGAAKKAVGDLEHGVAKKLDQ
jgi:uncharacterized protein YjbJ (UPF0337 family)